MFLNLRAASLAWTAVRRAGLGAVRDADVRALATWSRTSVWRIVADARRAGRGVASELGWSPRFAAHPSLTDLRASGPSHPWLRRLGHLPPAKRAQLGGVAQAMLANGDSRRARAGRVIHLPLQQPVLETCLRTPAETLVYDGRDRALARDAFADRLPADILARRSKGDLTAVYGCGLALALPLLRERLLGGELRRMDLLDAPVLEARLTAEALMREGGYGDLIDLLVIETWLQEWRGRA